MSADKLLNDLIELHGEAFKAQLSKPPVFFMHDVPRPEPLHGPPSPYCQLAGWYGFGWTYRGDQFVIDADDDQITLSRSDVDQLIDFLRHT